MANMEEVAMIVTILKQHDTPFMLLQCSSLYPAPYEVSNLLTIKTMRERFNCLTGYSDHTLGDHIPVAAVVLGAKLIEKHFTMDKSLDGPDHSFAMEPHEFKIMVDKIRQVESAMGDGNKLGPHELEKESIRQRRSIHAKELIKKGDKLTKETVTIKRPNTGLHPFKYNEILGKIAVKNIELDEAITDSKLKDG